MVTAPVCQHAVTTSNDAPAPTVIPVVEPEVALSNCRQSPSEEFPPVITASAATAIYGHAITLPICNVPFKKYAARHTGPTAGVGTAVGSLVGVGAAVAVATTTVGVNVGEAALVGVAVADGLPTFTSTTFTFAITIVLFAKIVTCCGPTTRSLKGTSNANVRDVNPCEDYGHAAVCACPFTVYVTVAGAS